MEPSTSPPARNNNNKVLNSAGLTTPAPSSPPSSQSKTSSNNNVKSKSNTIINKREFSKSDSFIDDEDISMSNTGFDSNDISMCNTTLNSNTSMSSSSVDIQSTTSTNTKRRSPRLAPRYVNRRSKPNANLDNTRRTISPIILDNKQSLPTCKTSNRNRLVKLEITPTFTPRKKQPRESPCLRSPLQKELADRLARLMPRTPCGCRNCKGERERRGKLL